MSNFGANDSDHSQTKQCDICANQRIDDLDGLTQLWDGKFYCDACIDQVGPRLKTLATKHRALSERLDRPTMSLFRFIRRTFLFSVLPVATFVSLLAFGLYMSAQAIPSWLDYCVGAVLAIFIGVVCAIPFSLFIFLLGRSLLPITISMQDGLLTTTLAKRLRTFEFHELTWALGTSRVASSSLALGNQDRVLLYNRHYTYPSECGFSESTLPVWTAFLCLTGMPCARRAKKQTFTAILLFVAVIVTLFAAHFLCTAFGLPSDAAKWVVILLFFPSLTIAISFASIECDNFLTTWWQWIPAGVACIIPPLVFWSNSPASIDRIVVLLIVATPMVIFFSTLELRLRRIRRQMKTRAERIRSAIRERKINRELDRFLRDSKRPFWN